MRKKLKIIIPLWISTIFLLNRLEIFNGNIDALVQLLANLEVYKIPLFLMFSTFRIITFLPGTLFMILGGLIFNPYMALALSVLSIFLSETIIFFIAKSLFGARLESRIAKKNPELHSLFRENNSKLLFLGVLCPLAPTDAICALASSTGISYSRFIIIATAANLPMISLYSFLGNSLLGSWFNGVILIISILIITLFSIRLWKNEQYKNKTLKQ